MRPAPAPSTLLCAWHAGRSTDSSDLRGGSALDAEFQSTYAWKPHTKPFPPGPGRTPPLAPSPHPSSRLQLRGWGEPVTPSPYPHDSLARPLNGFTPSGLREAPLGPTPEPSIYFPPRPPGRPGRSAPPLSMVPRAS